MSADVTQFVAAYRIPTQQGIPFWVQRTTLDGRDYNLRFAWNQREERWYLDINAGDDTPLLVGVKLVTNWPLLLGRHADPRLPDGELMVRTTLRDDSPPGLNDMGFGLRCELLYISPNGPPA